MQYQKCLLFCKSYYFLNVSKVVWFIVFMMNPFLTVIKTYSFVSPEAATRGVLYEKVFLEISRSCLRPATLLKKRLWHKCFPVSFAKLLRTPFLIEHLRWLLLFRISFVKTRLNLGTYDWCFRVLPRHGGHKGLHSAALQQKSTKSAACDFQNYNCRCGIIKIANLLFTSILNFESV